MSKYVHSRFLWHYYINPTISIDNTYINKLIATTSAQPKQYPTKIYKCSYTSLKVRVKQLSVKQQELCPPKDPKEMKVFYLVKEVETTQRHPPPAPLLPKKEKEKEKTPKTIEKRKNSQSTPAVTLAWKVHEKVRPYKKKYHNHTTEEC